MPRHRSLNLKKFIDPIPKPLIEEYFKQRVGDGASFSLKAFDCRLPGWRQLSAFAPLGEVNKWPEPAFGHDRRGQGIAESSNGF
jgi:hypothetical protein